MDEDIIEGEVIESNEAPPANSNSTCAAEVSEESELNPLLQSRARHFEQRLNLLMDYQQALLRMAPQPEVGLRAETSELAEPLVDQIIGTCGETLMRLGNWLLNSAASDKRPAARKAAPAPPFDKPYVFCYRDERGEDESTE